MMVQLAGAKRVLLQNRKLIEQRPEESPVERMIEGDEGLLEVLAERFGLRFPAGTRFPLEESPR